MRPVLLLLAVSYLCVAVTSVRRLHIGPLGGLEQAVENAIHRSGLGVQVVSNAGQADWLVRLEDKTAPGLQTALYTRNTGRTDVHQLTLIDVRSGRTLVRYSFSMPGNGSGRDRLAANLVSQMKKKLPPEE